MKALFKRSLLAVMAGFFVLGSVQTTFAELEANASTQELVLNGKGLRKKGPFKVYEASLFLPSKTTSATEAIAQAGPKRVTLLMLRTVKKKKMVGAIVDGFRANSDIATIQADVDKFVSLMSDAKKRHTIEFDYVPGVGTTISQSGEKKGLIAGDAFFTALLKVWLGDKPADARLKAAMLVG